MTDESYAADVAIGAPRDRVIEALTTLDGLAGWWTPTVSGSPEAGGEIVFGFADQRILMRVDSVVSPESVRWTCLSHSKFPEWQNTKVNFDLREGDAGSTLLAFRHAGLFANLACYTMCSGGWNHYLRSLGAHVVGEGGSPWGTPTWQPART